MQHTDAAFLSKGICTDLCKTGYPLSLQHRCFCVLCLLVCGSKTDIAALSLDILSAQSRYCVLAAYPQALHHRHWVGLLTAVPPALSRLGCHLQAADAI